MPLCGDKRASCLLSNQQVENLLPQVKFPPQSSLWRQDSIVSLVVTKRHRVSCGDKISSCRSCKLKTCTHNSNVPTRPLFVATRFHRVGEVQVENSHPHGKTCGHKNLHSQKAWNAALFGLSGQSPVRTGIVTTPSTLELTVLNEESVRGWPGPKSRRC